VYVFNRVNFIAHPLSLQRTFNYTFNTVQIVLPHPLMRLISVGKYSAIYILQRQVWL